MTILKDRGVFGTCSCGGDVVFYSNHGVQCKRCGKLYGIWQRRKKKQFKVEEKPKTESNPILGAAVIPLTELSTARNPATA